MTLEECGVRFEVPLGAGQKTGWFYDQRSNRFAMHKYVKGLRVLDMFSYVGAWGLQAAHAGATEVDVRGFLCAGTGCIAAHRTCQ